MTKKENKVYSYLQNSYHINDKEQIDWTNKFKKESEFQKLSPGGAISYIETPDLRNNIDSVLSVIKKGADTIMYFELNNKCLDSCFTCGGTDSFVWNNNTEKWECPLCGEDDPNNYAMRRRICGYIGAQSMNKGRAAEISDRVEHFGNEMDILSTINE